MLLLVIFILALLLRIYDLGSTPSGFHQDEVVNAYVGRFILDHGVDLYGNKWPFLYFDKHGDFPPVLPMYVSAIGTYFFGFTQFAARLPIALIGSLVVFPMFYITKLIFNKNHLAYLAAFMIAALPWHVSFSRIGSEGIIAVTIFTFAVWLFLSAVKKNHMGFFITSIVMFFSTYLLYPSFRIIVPLTLAAMTYIFTSSKKFKTFLIGVTIIAFMTTIFIAMTPWGKGRYEQTSLSGKYSAENNPMKQFIFNEDNVLIARIFNNKVVYIGRDFVGEYMSYFSPQFLFGQAGY